MRRTWGVSIALACFLGSATAEAAPPFPGTVTAGELRGISLLNANDPWTLGYWEYLPANYDTEPQGTQWPMLIFLAGIGEFDDVSVCPGNATTCTEAACGTDGLCRNLRWGPQLEMVQDNWNDVDRNFIFVSPQNDVATFSQQPWDLDELQSFIEYIVANYPVDPRRIYLTGMSQGGRAVLQWTQQQPRQFAAIAPLPGGAVDQDVTCYFEDTAMWILHGEDDNDGNLGPGVFDPCWMARRFDMFERPEDYGGFQTCVDRAMGPLPPGRFTMFQNTGHNAWEPSIDPVDVGFARGTWSMDEGCNEPDIAWHPYEAATDPDGIYSWFATLDRPEISVADVDVAHDVGTAMIPATVTDDDAVSWSWTQTSGPMATLMNDDTDTLSVVNPDPDTSYGFEVMVLDDDNQWDVAQVTLTVGPEPIMNGSTGEDGSTGAVSGGSTGAASGSTGGEGTSGGASGSASDSTTEGSGGSGSASGTTTGDPSGSGSASDSGATAGSGDDSAGTDTGADTDGDSSGAGADDDDDGGLCRVGGKNTPAGWALLLLACGLIRRRSSTMVR